MYGAVYTTSTTTCISHTPPRPCPHQQSNNKTMEIILPLLSIMGVGVCISYLRKLDQAISEIRNQGPSCNFIPNYKKKHTGRREMDIEIRG